MTRVEGSWQKRWFDRFYIHRPGWRDGTTRFHERVAERARRASGGDRPRILEVGAGPSNATSRFLAGLGPLTGVDPDPAVRDNDALGDAHVAAAGAPWPFPDASFDLCVSNYVVEHVTDPAAHLAEVARVLAPGGAYLFRAPNRWHPVSLVAAATPHRFHLLVANRLRGLPADAHDPYPTVYRMNTAGAIRRFAGAAGLEVAALEWIEPDPSYGASSRVLFLAFLGYERLVNSTPRLAGLRVNVLARLEKPAAARDGA